MPQVGRGVPAIIVGGNHAIPVRKECRVTLGCCFDCIDGRIGAHRPLEATGVTRVTNRPIADPRQATSEEWRMGWFHPPSIAIRRYRAGNPPVSAGYRAVPPSFVGMASQFTDSYGGCVSSSLVGRTRQLAELGVRDSAGVHAEMRCSLRRQTLDE